MHTRPGEEAARYKVEIRDLLVVLFPEFTQVFADPAGKTASNLLKLYPSAQSIIEAGVETISAKLRELAQRNYGRATAEKLLELAKWSAAPGLANAARSKSLTSCATNFHTLRKTWPRWKRN